MDYGKKKKQANTLCTLAVKSAYSANLCLVSIDIQLAFWTMHVFVLYAVGQLNIIQIHNRVVPNHRSSQPDRK